MKKNSKLYVSFGFAVVFFVGLSMFLMPSLWGFSKADTAVEVPEQVPAIEQQVTKEEEKVTEEIPVAPVENQKVAYLTFDDGPSKSTPEILEILKKNNIKATFFVNGKESTTLVPYYKQIIDEGHVLGNHTYTHDFAKVYASLDNFKEEFESLQKYITDVTGVTPTTFRHPGGSMTSKAKKYGTPEVAQQIIAYLKEKNVTYYDWDIDSGDSNKKTVEKETIVKTVLESSANKKGSVVILMHDGVHKHTSVEGLQEIIDGLKQQGYTFGTTLEDAVAPQQLK